ncbi:hemagglutinin repeat-containing protein [Pantoea agglomerans]|jgi:filamentous hemagglutinin|uniref:hemagglutinin repeat-containing protein n=1 Tax=Enterobacter agglomerans TaxID=549 RepID=UPI00155992E8|nr:hemagglutinin repeat-containing protein [Pantoea agglomerans]MBD8253043.1 hemagglutinin repeat-containing protein [Pantoea agglomerans]NQS81149.1 filamentous hemagglutinin N-terminal domain-containing protein [Pantoea agglomerans]UEG74378.1 hemagglutinin repeat-containing protein [Pantoea agglomerans]WAB87746.1 hemagglutinin repeat-containing protein [Pantoea agglomerans]
MNKHCYRIIFSRTHGELRVVSELARSCSTEPGQSRGNGTPRLWVTLRRAAWLLGMALFAGPAMANGIVADSNATPGQRPDVIATQNGLPQVNITAPNQAGISHNQYQQFDVAQNGAILNNSAVMTSTQLAGMIQGNPNLNPDTPAARVIINEVNSNNPSQLRGYMEVAGGRAQVIVANPAGIVCNGCGTINAGRMTLTTGKPQLNADGSLAGYQVERGVVRIEGGGLNGDPRHDTEYVDVLARAVEINAGIWAKKELAVVAGRNRVSADAQTVTPLADDGSARPELAIDMGQMGGMYSGQIRMIGTEAGVGVRNQNAQVQAGKTLVVSSEGKLVWQSAAQDGVTQAGGDISLAAREDIDYQGKLHSGGQLTVRSREGGITQSGTLAAAGDVRLMAARSIQSSGHLLAGSDASSQVVQEANLQLESQDTIRASGSLLSKKEVSARGRRVDLSGAQVAASRATLTAQEGGVAVRQAVINGTELVINTAGDIEAQQAQISAGRWQIDGRSLFSQQAGWSQTGSGESRFTLSGGLDNSDGAIESRQLSFRAASLNNQRGRMVALDNAAQKWRIDGLLDNTAGELGNNGDLTLEAGSLTNQGGTVKTKASLAINASTAVNNSQGKLLAGDALTLSAGGDLDNHAGTLNGGQLSLTAQHLNNAQGEIVSQGDLDLTALQGLDNSGGWIEAGHHLSLNSGGLWQNRDGTAQGGERVTAAADQLNNASGRLQSGGDLDLTSRGDILNQSGKLTAKNALAVHGTAATLFDNDGGSLQSGGDLLLQGGALNNRQSGQILSQQALTLNLAGDWDNQGGTLTGNGRTQASAANLFNAQGAINALDTLDMQVAGHLDNSNGRIFSRLNQALQAQEMRNAQGWMGSQGSWTATTAGFDNTAGSVQSQQQAELSANWLSNASGVLQSAAGMALRIEQDINNLAGKVSAQQQLTVQGQTEGSRTGNINNAGGQWLAGEGLTITAARIDNTQGGLLFSQRQLKLNLAGDLHNQAGKMQSGEAFQLDAQTLNNAGGNIDSQQQLTLQLSGQFDNNGGAVRSNGGQQINAATINNRQGVFSSREAINLATGQLENASGTLISQGAGSYHVGTLNNQQGKVHSGAALTLEAAQLNNQGGQFVATQDLVLNATAIDNSTQGVISSQAGLSLQADRLINRDGGLLLGTTHTDISARDIDNSAGRLQSAGTLRLRGVAQLDNRQGRVLANGDLTLNGDLSPTDSPLVLLNQSGRLESAGALNIHAHSFDNQGGTLLGLQALTLSAQQDYTRQADETISSNGTVTVSLSGAFTNLVDWLLPGNLVLNAAGITNPAMLVGKTVQLTTGALLNSGRLEADDLTLSVDSLDNRAALMGDEVTVRGRVIDNHGQPAVIAATQNLTLQARERLSNTDGALLYSGNRLSLQSDDLIENRASFVEADGYMTLEARRLNNLREGLVIEREAETSDYKWHRYNYYWRSFGTTIMPDKSSMAPTTQQLTFQDEAAAQSNPYGTLLAIDAAGKRAQVRVMNNQGVLTDLWVNYLALNPGVDGTYAMTFYETRGFKQKNVLTPYQNTVWREHDRGRIEQWDPEQHIDIDSALFISDYSALRERSVTGTLTRDRLVNEGIGARILAGGDMLLRITGALLNDASVITANGNLTLDGGGSIDNRGYSINERRQEVIVDHYDRSTRHWYPTFNSDETTALATVDGIITGNGNVSINGTSISNTTVNQAQISQLEAALQAVDAERAEYERNPLAFAVDGVARHDGDTELTTGNNTTGRPLLPAELALTALQQLEKVATTIPNNGLFSQHTAAGSPYLIVTDERFTSQSKFISSDYLLERVGYDPSQVHKRLGDGFYEQRLVREQVLKLTGRPSVNGWDAMAQYQELMNNGSKVAQDFHLMPGVALTPQQIAALQQDIVWLVSETVDTADGPQTVWVPKVYLAQTTLRLTGAGAVIGGGNLQLSADSVTNAGNLFADQALSIDSGQFQHLGGDITAGSIDVKAETLTISTELQNALRQATMSAEDISLSGTDIRLQGAKLNATNNLSLSAHNNLEIGAAKSSHSGSLNVISGAMGNRTSSGIEEAGRRMAQVSGEWQQAQGSELNAGGNLLLSAGRDLTLTGSQASASGSARVQAGGDIHIGAETTTNATHLEAGSRTSSVSNSRTEDRLVLSTLSGDQGVTLVAGNNLLAEGAQVDSTEGRIGISAQNVTIKDARASLVAQDSENKREGNTRTHREEESVRESSTGSTFSGQQGVTVIGREGDVTVIGSTLHSEQGAVGLQAKQDVVLNTATERESLYSEERSENKGLLNKSSSHSVTRDVTTRENGSLLSGESVTVIAGRDLTVTGSAVAADQDVNLRAGRDVEIGAATETDSHYQLKEKKKSGLMSSGGIGFTIGKQSTRHEIDEKGTTQSQSVSTVGSSQGSVNVTAGNRLHVGGADLVAGKDMNLTGDSVTIDPGFDSRSRKETFEQKQSGLSIALSGTAGSALNTAVSSTQQARKSGDGRVSALQNTQAALNGVQAAQAAQMDGLNTAAADAHNAAGDLKPGQDGYQAGSTNTIGVSASYGSQSSKSEARTESSQSQGSTLTAGRNLTVTATGKNGTAQSGDISITGSQLKAGGDLSLDASRDILLQSAQNTQSTDGKNSSKGGSVGVGIGVGSGGYGISVSASVNAAKGSEKGNGLTHSETTLDAGNRLSLTSGRDITLTGAQASGESVKVDAGRNLTLTSEQDSDRYDSKQQSASAGGSFTFGSMTGSANVNVSRDKMHSTWQSVAEQTGIFAGKGGFDVTVGEHTQLNGAVISSTATADKNRLDTGTLGFGDIENHAEYEVEHQSAGMSTGGSIGGQFAGNMANGMLAGLNDSGSADSVTKAAVSEGTIVIRDKEKQAQDVADLSRDVANANPGLDVIFNKEKEQNRLKVAQLIGEIGAQAGDIARTQGEIIATRAANEKMSGAMQTDRDRALSELKAKDPTKQYSASDVNKQVYSNYYNQAFVESGFGTGGKVQQAINAVTAAVQGLSGGNVAQALSGAASPYLAEQIHKLTEGNPEAQAMAHAVVGAVASYASGNSALAGAAGAVSGEVMAKLVMNQLYPGKAVSGLTETEKQTISALGTLAAGLAGGVVGDSAAGAVAGAQAGQNAVNNNLFGGTEAGQKKFVQKQGKDVMSCADDPSSVSCQRGEAVNKAIAGALATGGVASLTAPAQAMWALGAGVNAGAQYAEDGTVNPVNSVVAGWTNVITIGNGLTGTVIWNAVGGALTNQINGDDPLTGAITNGAGSALGYGAGKLISSGTNAAGKWITGGWDPKFNPDLLKYTEVKGQLGISKEMLPSKYPSAAGNVGASYVSEKSGNILQDQIKSNGDAN